MKNLIKQINLYQKEHKAISKELKNAPKGYLVKRGKRYAQRIGKKEMGITTLLHQIKALCRKRYLLARQEQLQQLLATPLDKVAKLTLLMPQALIATFPQAYQNLPISYFYHPKIQPWLDHPHQQNDHPTGSNHYTKNGITFRSKSEMIIAGHLDAYGLIYKTDIAQNFTTGTTYPDFVIKNPFTNKTVLWEHFGLMGHPKYEQRMNEKLDLYLTHGYTDQTLIYTFESHIKNEKRIQKFIEAILL